MQLSKKINLLHTPCKKQRVNYKKEQLWTPRNLIFLTDTNNDNFELIHYWTCVQVTTEQNWPLKAILHGNTIASGKKRELNPYVQKKAACPQKAAWHNDKWTKTKWITNKNKN